MAFVSEIIAQLKGDTTDFRSKMDEAGESVESFDKKVKKFGLGFGGVAALAGAFRAIVDHARDLEGPLDANQKRAKEFAAGLDEAKKSALDVGVAVMGTVNGFGEWIGRQIAIVKYGKEQVEVSEQIEKQTQQTLEAIEQDKKRTEEIGAIRKQIVEAQKRGTDEAFKQLTIDDQIAQTNAKIQAAKDAMAQAGEDRLARAQAELVLEQERANLVKLNGDLQKEINKEQMEAEKEAAKEREKDIEEHIKDQDKLAKLKEQWAEEEDDRLTDRIIKEREGREAAARDLDLQLRLLQEQGTSQDVIIQNLKDRGFAEDEILKRINKQTEAIQFQVRIQSKGRGDTDLSDRVLEDKIANLQKQIAQIEFENFTSPLAYRNPLLAPLQKELAFAQDELGDRARIRSQVSQFGEAGAAAFYRGQMDQFERLLKFVQEQPDTKRAADGITELNQRLAASGIFPKK